MKVLKKLSFEILNKRTLVVFILALAIRLVLMPITLHTDVWAIAFSEYLFSFKGVVNVYDYLAKLPESSPIVQNYGRNFFTYPPLAYFTFGFFGSILKPLLSSDFFSNLASNLPNILADKRLGGQLFLIKLPYLFFDFGILWLLLRLVEEKRKKVLIALLWLFNPLVFYTSYMVGQFDIIPVFFVLLCLFLLRKEKHLLAAFCLGIGGAYKMFPLFFLPFLAMSTGKSFLGRLKIFLVGLLPYLLTILPFLGTLAFRQSVLLSNQSQKMLFAKINVSGAEYLSVFVVIYIALLVLSLFIKLDLWKWFLAVMLLFFSITHYHPQWFLWLTPFLILYEMNYSQNRLLPLILFFSWFLIMILFEPSLSIGLFAPISESLGLVPPLSGIVNKFYDVFQLKSLIRSVFTGVSLAIMIILLRKDENS